jgi:hypothetical protein
VFGWSSVPSLSYALSSTNVWVQDNVHLWAFDTQEHAELLDKGEPSVFPLGANDFSPRLIP